MKNFVLAFGALLLLVSCHKEKPPAKDINIGSTTTTTVIPTSSVVLNPSGNAPLSALLTFTSAAAGHTEIVVKGKNGAASDIRQIFTDNGTKHSIPILGLYPNYKNTVQVYVIDANNDTVKSTVSITTGALPSNMPNYIHTDITNVSGMESGLNLVSNFSGYPTPPNVPYIIDSYGDIRWYLNFSGDAKLNSLFYDCGISRLQNGDFYFADQVSNTIYEVDVLGKIINVWSLGDYIFHHNVVEKPNGNFLISVSKTGSTHPDGSPTNEDYIIEIDHIRGNIITTWDLKESLDEFRTALSKDPIDWIHVNGLFYDASDNTIIVSGRVQGMIKLTNDNHVKWILGPHKGWGKNRRGEDLNQFLLKPLDAAGNLITDTAYVNGSKNHPDFEWSWYQHSPILIPNGDLMLFDNGTTRNFIATAPIHYSRAVEYKIDASKMTVKQIWEYGKERNGETFSSIVSSVKYLPRKNHVLLAPGYQVANATGLGGKIVEIDYATRNVVFQQSISSVSGWGWHRVERLELYPNGDPYKQ
jgi:arylsulfate sulfotransferase